MFFGTSRARLATLKIPRGNFEFREQTNFKLDLPDNQIHSIVSGPCDDVTVPGPADQHGVVLQTSEASPLDQVGRPVSQIGGDDHLRETLHLLRLHQLTQRLRDNREGNDNSSTPGVTAATDEQRTNHSGRIPSPASMNVSPRATRRCSW
ncbi:hypothetical protein EYF80_041052 [Liparis tanakae]|uniref:Uncharacterized protein n=1 Tax=Liparis tanakae TaxID=230148 RepID=A0A4Z2G5C0_9TELE|nr:hypothetical protein EYF80_041052 [Liparis tanakae]